MRSTIKIQKTPSSGPGQSLTLTGCIFLIVKDYLKPGNLYLSQDFPHRDRMTPIGPPSLSGRTTLWMIKNWKVVDFFVFREKDCAQKYYKGTDSTFVTRTKFHDSL